MNSLERRLFNLEGRQSFPAYRPQNDEELIYSLMRQAKRAGYYSGELPPEPPERRVPLEILRDEEAGKHLSEWFREAIGDYSSPSEEFAEDLARKYFPFFEQLMSRTLSREGKEKWELWKNIHNID